MRDRNVIVNSYEARVAPVMMEVLLDIRDLLHELTIYGQKMTGQRANSDRLLARIESAINAESE